MTIPSTATAVRYTAFFYNGDSEHPGAPHIEMQLNLEVPLTDASSHPELRELIDQAAAAAALAWRDVVQTAYPGTHGGADRTYLCQETGGPWPPMS
ncbi:hypothetical protein [Streptomyces sp. NPDC088182]|uniref:hypothetical protein n=1 Tax=Streptomyces sp. NPDC088182 TaxID=3365838 RepID=UPI0038185A2F